MKQINRMLVLDNERLELTNKAERLSHTSQNLQYDPKRL